MEKYTIEQFKEMYQEAQTKVINKMQKDMKESDSANRLDALYLITFSLQNMWCLEEMYRTLFRE